MSITSSDISKLFKSKILRVITAAVFACVVIAVFGAKIVSFAATKTITLNKPVFVAERKYDSALTHPYNKQTNTIIVDWQSVKNAKSYELYVKGGKYGNSFKLYKTVTDSVCTVTDLERCTNYSFRVRAVNGKVKSPMSDTQVLKTARIDFDQAGWEAMCRIVYHEVGGINSSFWDKPIVYVSDCVVNTYVAAKYTNNKNFANYYKKYNSIQDIIYKSGGFMSDKNLTRDGATYKKVTEKVKTAVWGATYARAALNDICNDFSVYFWSNRSYSMKSSKISYSFKIPWGYFYVWNTYWG